MTETAAQIRKWYIEPPLTLIETEYEKLEGRGFGSRAAFEVRTKIWVDQHLPLYRVVIPEVVEWPALKTYPAPVKLKFLTYIPTGRVVYDNTLPHPEAIVYEYILESLLGKKDLVHE